MRPMARLDPALPRWNDGAAARRDGWTPRVSMPKMGGRAMGYDCDMWDTMGYKGHIMG